MNLDGWEGTWNGDVWKTIVYLRSHYKNLHVYVLNTDHGLGIIRKGKPDSMLDFSLEAINNFNYDDLVINREKWLNIKEVNSNVSI